METVIVPFERILDLSAHYTSGNQALTVFEDEMKSISSQTEEAKGEWATDQVKLISKSLDVLRFVMPISAGGVELPVIQEQLLYIQAHKRLKMEAIESLEATFDDRQAYCDSTQGSVKRAMAELMMCREAKPKVVMPLSAEATVQEVQDAAEAYEAEQDKIDEATKMASMAYQALYKDWRSEQDLLVKDEQRVRDWEQEAHKNGVAQHVADTDALKNAVIALNVLKRQIHTLLKKIPSLESVVRTRGPDGVDPFEVGDMRGVLANLMKRFKSRDSFSVFVCIMGAMQEQQKEKSLLEYFTYYENLVSGLTSRGVTTVDISDLAAMIFLCNVQAPVRQDFMKLESTISLTTQLNGDEEDEEGDADDTRSTVSRKRREKPLFAKAKSYVHENARNSIVNANVSVLRGGKGGPVELPQINPKDSASNLKRQVAAMNKIYATAVKRENKGACVKYIETGGNCTDPACHFVHDPAHLVTSGGKGGVKLCKDFMNGNCRFNPCRFSHQLPKQAAGGSVPGVAKESSRVQGGTQAANGGSHGAVVQQQGGNKEPSAATQTLFALKTRQSYYHALRGDSPFDDEDKEGVNVVIMQDAAVSEVCMAARVAKPVTLGWDSMASVHVSQSETLLENVRPLRKAREAVGIGGVKAIKCQGDSPVFGLKNMCVIEGATTPNLMSLGRRVQPNGDGVNGYAVMSPTGGVIFRLPYEAECELMAMCDRWNMMGFVEGTSALRGFVYEQVFGEEDGIDDIPEAPDVEQSFAVTLNMYAGRVHMDRAEGVIDFLVQAGLSAESLKNEKRALLGLPEVVTADKVDHYFKYVGKDVQQMEAEIVTAPLRQPKDYVAEVVVVPGGEVQIDNVDPSFSRMKQLEREVLKDLSVRAKYVSKVVPAIGGYKDAVLSVDGASLYAEVEGRVSKRDPIKIVEAVMAKWNGRWPNVLRVIKVDDEFAGKDIVDMARKRGVHVWQSLPGDHRRNTGRVEGVGRWIQQLAQGFMNRLKVLYHDGTITEGEARSFWFLALKQACLSWNMKPARSDPTKTRYEVGTGYKANLSDLVMMPFGMRIIARKPRSDADGRGYECLYLGASLGVRGGVVTYCLETRSLAIKYSFQPISAVVRMSDAKQQAIQRAIYGKAKVASAGPVVTTGADSAVIGDGDCTAVPVVVPAQEDNAVGIGDDRPPADETSDVSVVAGGGQGDAVASSTPAEGESPEPVRTSVPLKTVVFAPPMVSNYGTRSKAARSMVFSVEEESDDEEEAVEVDGRPPKPVVPSQKVCAKDPRWIAADVREGQKLEVMNTFIDLPMDEMGRSVVPSGSIKLRLLRVREYKWKPNPDTGEMCWLECVRFVCDGSQDKRPDVNYYAETPDRALLFLMTSVGATLGEAVSGADVERAYLNALSIDRNIVVLAAHDMHGVPRVSLLNKGLYGSRGGALSWQRFIDEKMVRDLGYKKLDAARGVYIKKMTSGFIVRAYRHSDDFRVSSLDEAGKVLEEAKMREAVKMSEFVGVERFLGCTFEYLNEAGEVVSNGCIVLVRQREKILEMQSRFAHLHTKFNPNGRPRKVPVPLTALALDESLSESQVRILDSGEVGDFQAVVGCINWITCSTRPDAKFGCFVVAQRMSAPREWDMFLAVHVMDYLVGTVDAPLVLGGPVVDPEVHADASFATLKERRSVVGHVVTTCPGSGAIIASVSSTKCAVTSVWEAEVIAGSEGIDSGLYISRVCEELLYPVEGSSRRVKVDNQAEVDWMKGSVPSKRSRHIDIKYYHAKHMQEDGQVSVEFVATEDNMADILTKPLPVEPFTKFAGMILGHALIRGFGVKGEIGGAAAETVATVTSERRLSSVRGEGSGGNCRSKHVSFSGDSILINQLGGDQVA